MSKNPIFFKELVSSCLNYKLWLPIAKSEIKALYNVTFLSLLWIPLKSLVIISALVFINYNFLNQNITFTTIYISLGYIIWTFISETLIGSCKIFLNMAGYIKNIKIYIINIYLIHFYKSLFNLFINIIFFFPIILFLNNFKINIFYCSFGLIILLSFVFFCGIIFAILNTRYRDFSFAIEAFFRILFFVTPVWWIPSEKVSNMLILKLNLFYHLIENIRSPFININHDDFRYVYCISAVLFCIFFLKLIYKKTKNLVFWI